MHLTTWMHQVHFSSSKSTVLKARREISLSEIKTTASSMQVHFSVSGTAVGPAVQLGTSCLSFGSLKANETLAKAIYIHNKAELPIYFQFEADPLGVFALDRVRGSVAGMSSTHVTVTFQPKEASNFWRRITCLIRVRGCHTSFLIAFTRTAGLCFFLSKRTFCFCSA